MRNVTFHKICYGAPKMFVQDEECFENILVLCVTRPDRNDVTEVREKTQSDVVIMLGTVNALE